MKTAFFLALVFFAGFGRAMGEPPAFKLKGMKLFSDKIINKAEATSGGFKIQGGIHIGDTGPGSELPGFEFPETQLKQYFTFQFGSAAAGKTLSMIVTGEKTTLGQEIQVISLSGKVGADGDLPASFSLKNNWPVGLYRVDFRLGDDSVGSAGYLVKATADRTAPIALKDLKIYTTEKNQGVERKSPKPGDHYLEFHTSTSGAKTAGAAVKFTLWALDSAGKPATQVLTTETKDWPLENTTLIHSAELPKDWPVGKYRIDYEVDGKLAGSEPFEIKN